MRNLRLPALAIVAAIVIGLSACSSGGRAADQRTETAVSLANQRKAALQFVGNRHDVEQIRFTDEGRSVGLGGSLWSASAVITLDGKEYEGGLGFDPGTSFGDPMPDAAPNAIFRPVTVIYSDGTSEVLN